MKKLLLTTAAAAMLVTSSSYAAEGDFYLKANGGWTKLDHIKRTGTKAKSQNSGFLGAGAGYHVMDNVRVDLTYDHFFNPNFKVKADSTKLKGEIDTLLLNAFVDVYDMDAFKVFVGAGVGASNIKAKLKGDNIPPGVKSKAKKNVAFAAYLGTSYEFAPCVTGELTYSYRDMGKTKKLHDHTGTSIRDTSFHYKGHNIGAGVRFDL
ncbi:MAG: outer membrane protein [Rickettsiaceae bacterium]